MSKIIFYLSILNLLYFITTFFIYDSTNPFTLPLFGPPIIAFFSNNPDSNILII